MMQPESGSRVELYGYISHFPLGLELYFILLLFRFDLHAALLFFLACATFRIKKRVLFILPYCYRLYTYAGKTKE